MLPPTSSPSEIEVTTLSQLSPVGAWQVELCHDRAQDLVIWLTRGQGRVLLDGKRHGFGPHNLFYIPAGALWSLDLGRQCIGSCLFLPRNSMSGADQSAFFLRVNDSQEQAYINFMIERLQREQREQRDNWPDAMKALSQVLLIEIERTAVQQNKKTRATAAQRLSRAYCERVARMFGDGATMSDHADALDVTPTHLTRVCKAETGKTAANLLTERQLHCARSLLTYSDAPIQDIANRLSFGSPAYFTRFISQHTGLTPSRLRKAARATT
ncbi:AraC family transcriptional regulator [Epibacterium ulvae]|uniref:AraC family transcriptional regulator n=1 Tax=Epibacterium ulvae TaxID=1156985 RepID=UPI001BFC1976|nr:AraC family transcriptional regulator [Epibacterium ulvae]MBT8156039.1 AraC family transcriptional regulator [Epibacterium ulvae]